MKSLKRAKRRGGGAGEGWSADLGVGELAEHGGQPVVLDVAVRLDGHVQDVDGLVHDALGGGRNNGLTSRRGHRLVGSAGLRGTLPVNC